MVGPSIQNVASVGGVGLNRRERRKLEVRNRILEASTELFEAQGIEETTVLEICERADVAHKTFFNHFVSRGQLLQEIAQHALDQLLSEIEETCDQPTSTRERIHHFFGQLAQRVEERGPMHRELLWEMVRVAHEPGKEQEQARKLHDAFGAIVREGAASGDLRSRHGAETLTEMLVGAFYVLMFNWANLDNYPLGQRALAAARFLADSMTLPEEESP